MERIKNNLGETVFLLEILDGPTGGIETLDVKPKKLEHSTPILVAPGWGETVETFRGTLNVFAQHGWRSISLSHPRSEMPNEIGGAKGYTEEYQKALSLLAVLAEKRLEKVDIVAHSEGAISASLLSLMTPEMIRTLILVNPAGLHGKDSFINLAGRFSKEAVKLLRQYSQIEARVAIAETVKYILSNVQKAIREGQEIATAHLDDVIKDIVSRGIKVHIVGAVNDSVFPPDKLQKVAAPMSPNGFYSVIGSHNDIYLKPEQFVKIVENALK